MSDSDEDVVNVSDHSEDREERGERKTDNKLEENEEADATWISVHPIIGKKQKRSTNGTKSKRKSFVKIEDETAGDYYQDVETGDTVWDVPSDGDVIWHYEHYAYYIYVTHVCVTCSTCTCCVHM